MYSIMYIHNNHFDFFQGQIASGLLVKTVIDYMEVTAHRRTHFGIDDNRVVVSKFDVELTLVDNVNDELFFIGFAVVCVI
jgi:hypothetical protein